MPEGKKFFDYYLSTTIDNEKHIKDAIWESITKREFKDQYKMSSEAMFASCMPNTPNSTTTFPPKTTSFERPCTHCAKPIHIENEEVFTISYEPTREQKLDGDNVKTKFFHKACFEEVAGKDYMM